MASEEDDGEVEVQQVKRKCWLCNEVGHTTVSQIAPLALVSRESPGGHSLG